MLEVDYLVVGAGAMGLAFVDELLAGSDCRIALVDRRVAPGGHWQDAYSFVRLHQPSAYYGAGSLVLGSNRLDETGFNRGLHEMASGGELLDYYRRLLTERLLPSGRLHYFPESEYRGDTSLVSLRDGAVTKLQIRRRVVDATYTSPRVPASTEPCFAFPADARPLRPDELPAHWREASCFMLIGAGKTAMDVAVWLQQQGVLPEAIRWLMPRDSWLINRETVQPGARHYPRFLRARAEQLECCAQAASESELFASLEARGLLLRLDARVRPRMFHLATVAPAELAILRRITDVTRLGHLEAIGESALRLQAGSLPRRAGECYVDCSASALQHRPPRPVFEEKRITLQMIRAGQFCLSAAAIAHLELDCVDDGQRNALAAPLPLPDSDRDWLDLTLADGLTQARWQQRPALRRWLRHHRLSGAGLRGTAADEAELSALRQRIASAAASARDNLRRLIAQRQ